MSWPEVGAKMPPLVREMSSWRMVAYGGATWDWHRLHHDQQYAVSTRGMPGPIVDGQQFGGFLVLALQQWLGPDAAIRKLSFRFAAGVYMGETVRCEGEVTEALEDGIRCDLHVRVIDAEGNLLREALTAASAEVQRR